MKHLLLHPCPDAVRHCAAQPRVSFAAPCAAPSLPRGGMSLRRAAALVLLAMATASARAETVAIASAADWSSFAARVTAGEGTLDATMTADVTLSALSPRVGSESNPFMGTFDGDGHTLTVDWTFTGTDYAAPFAAIDGCTIKDLQVAGTIRSDAKYNPRSRGAAPPSGSSAREAAKRRAADSSAFWKTAVPAR